MGWDSSGDGSSGILQGLGCFVCCFTALFSFAVSVQKTSLVEGGDSGFRVWGWDLFGLSGAFRNFLEAVEMDLTDKQGRAASGPKYARLHCPMMIIIRRRRREEVEY